MISCKDISVVVQGIILPGITAKTLKSIRKFLPEAEVILSTWEDSDLSGISGLYDKIILNKDPGGVIFDDKSRKTNSLNRILLSSKTGIDSASRKYVLRLRSDLILKNANLLALEDDFKLRTPDASLFKNKIFAYEIFSIKYNIKNNIKQRTLFHVSDWCYLGLKEDLQEMFSLPAVEEPEFSRYFETHKKPSGDIHIHKLWKMSPEQYLTSLNAAKVFKDLKFTDYLDINEETIRFSEAFIINNFRLFSAKKWGISILKKPLNTYNISVLPPFSYYSEIEQKRDYKKYCEPSAKIPNYKFLEQIYSLKYFEILRRHFLQLIFCPWIRKPSEIASTALYFFLFLFALIKKD